MKKAFRMRALAALGLVLGMGAGEAAAAPSRLFLRGTFNDWAADEMLCSYRYGLSCAAAVSFGPGARFKFDEKGDWSQSYGDDVFHSACTGDGGCGGRLVANGGDIRLEGDKSYVIRVNLGWADQYSVYETAPFPRTLDAAQDVRKQSSVSVTGGYGSRTVEARLLVRNGGYHKRVGVRYSFQSPEGWREALASYQRTRDDGVEVWMVRFCGYGHARYEVFYEQLDDTGAKVLSTAWDRGPADQGYHTADEP